MEIGGTLHMHALAMMQALGIEVDCVDLGSASDRNVAFLGGQVDILEALYSQGEEYIKSGDYIPLFVFGNERNANFPDIPCSGELGFSFGAEWFYYFGFKKGTDPEIIEKFTEAVGQAVEMEPYTNALSLYDFRANFLPGEEGVAFMKEVQEVYRPMAEATHGQLIYAWCAAGILWGVCRTFFSEECRYAAESKKEFHRPDFRHRHHGAGSLLLLDDIWHKSFLGTGRGRTSPDLIPKIVAVAMFVIGAVIVVQWLVRVKRGKVEPVVVQRETEESTGLNAQQLANRRLFQQITMPVTLVLIFCYIFAMSRIGFTLSTFAFLTFQITLLSTDLSASSWLKSLAIALIASVGIYLIFGCAFSLAVPKVSFVDLGLSELYRMVLN